MAPSPIRALACAGALAAPAAALSRQPGTGPLGAGGQQEVPEQPPAPRAADLERWARGPLFSERGSLHHATVRSHRGTYDLTIAPLRGGQPLAEGWESGRTAELCRQFRDTAGEVGNFLDVGASIGTVTIPMADCLRFRGGRVIAVEGSPRVADHLAVGILANNLQNVDMYMYAVGAPDDRGVVTTGDRMLASNPAMKAILAAKVGIEGHEGHFLKNSQRLFSTYPPCIMTIELVPERLERAGTPVEGVLDMLASWGYSDVPTAANLGASSAQGGTMTLTQKDLPACLERVRARAAESSVRSGANFSDPGALSAALAREARARELIAMLRQEQPRRPAGAVQNASEPQAGSLLKATEMASDPMVADLERWGRGPLLSGNGSLHRARVASRRGAYDLTVAAFGRREDREVSSALLDWKGWENDQNAEMCGQFFKDTGPEAGNFLDVGANLGTFTIPMADCLTVGGRGGRVIAVEGMPPIADHLAVGILANNLQNVDMYMYAVGAPDDPKEVTMTLNPVNKASSAVKGNKPLAKMSTGQLEEYQVPLTTGDRMLASNPAMKAILVAKVGIEGHEGHFLEGSQRLFSQYPPCIMTIELVPHRLQRAGTPVEGILVQLASWGYGDVPTAAHLRASSAQGRTRTLAQRDLPACLERVRAHAAESRIPPPNFSDPDALSTAVAREARAKELDAMLVTHKRPRDWWRRK